MLKSELLRLFPRLRSLPEGAYVVGGAVRDLILGAAPADVDVACLDPLRCARSLGRNVIRLGREDHLSAWRVVDGPHVYDFAALLDGSVDADLARRDFTINAMAVALDSGALLDPHDGRADLERRLVRMIDASNFDDDPLRILKAVRMAVRLDFAIEEQTMAAIRVRAARITEVAVERVAYELTVIFSADAFRRAIALLHEAGLDVPLFGDEIDIGRYLSDEVPVAAAFALLVTDPEAFARRWRFSGSLQRDMLSLRRLLDSHSLLDLYDAGESVASQLPAMLRAVGRDDRIVFPDFAVRPFLSGDEIADLMQIEPGPEIGRWKRALLEAQLSGRVRTGDEAVAFLTASA